VTVVTLLMLHSYSTVPLYRAQARLEINDPQMIDRGVSPDRPRYRDPEPYYQTQYRIIQSPDLARRVVPTLDLQSVPEFSGDGSKKFGPGAAHPLGGQWRMRSPTRLPWSGRS
jgi:uncharacterized protein involved in exopolysaccharide biosynthesis